GDLAADHRDEQVGEPCHQRQGNGHHQCGLQVRGNRQGRADSENLQAYGVVVEDRIEQNLLDSGLRHAHASPVRRLAIKVPKPFSPNQKCSRLFTPFVVRVAPARPSTWCWALGLCGSTLPLTICTAKLSLSSNSSLPGHRPRHFGLSTSPPRPGVSPCW